MKGENMFDDMKQKMQGVVDLMKQDLNGVKTGRAKPSMIEQIKVEAYAGTWMPLLELSSINAPDPHMLLVQPWDHSVTAKIEKALATAEIPLNPVVDGNVIRITIPPLTEETRKEMVKLVKQKIESGKEMLRGIRNDVKREIDNQKDDAGVSEDDIKSWLEEMQKINDNFMKTLEDLGDAKEKELMEI